MFKSVFDYTDHIVKNLTFIDESKAILPRKKLKKIFNKVVHTIKFIIRLD
jgi:hypothetical protein